MVSSYNSKMSKKEIKRMKRKIIRIKIRLRRIILMTLTQIKRKNVVKKIKRKKIRTRKRKISRKNLENVNLVKKRSFRSENQKDKLKKLFPSRKKFGNR